MRLTLLILLSALLSASGAGAVMHLHSGTDAYGQGLSYPGYNGTPFIASFVAQDHTSHMAPVFLASTLRRPEFRGIRSINRSDYYPLHEPMWLRYSFYPTLYGPKSWSPESYEEHVPAVKEFMRADWKPAPNIYDTPAVEQFLESDSPPRSEPHDDPDRIGLVRFLDDDELPGRPLL